MNTPGLRPDHDDRMHRARLSLAGLSVGDAFGQMFFNHTDDDWLFTSRTLPEGAWNYTDDTVMAMSIVETLERFGEINQDALAASFARRYALEPDRGYGGSAHNVLMSIGAGKRWRDVAGAAISGMGSMGNGAAMRVAPLGAYCADDTEWVVKQARASSEITHSNPEGIAGGIAVALAAAFAWNHRAELAGSSSDNAGTNMLEFVLSHTPDGDTRVGVEKALHLSRELSVQTAVGFLGNGLKVTAPDTVPFSLWCAARHFYNYADALWTTVSGLGDRDTTCAIVGGIVVLSAGPDSIPPEWFRAREPLKM